VITDIFPPAWFAIEYLEVVIEYIRWMEIDPEDKKQLIMEWAWRSNVKLTADMVTRSTGVQAGQI